MKPWALAIGALLLLALALLILRERREQPALLAGPAPAQNHEQSSPAQVATVASATESAPAQARTESVPQPTAASPAAPPHESADILVRGSVRDEHGELLPGCGLVWIDENGGRRDVSAQAGAFSVPGLHAGAYIVVLWGADLRREEIDTVLGAQPDVQQRDFVAHAQPDIIVRLKGRDAAQPNAGDAGAKKKVRLDLGLTVRASLHEPRAELRSMPNDSVEYSECGTYRHGMQARAGSEVPADAIGRLVLSEPLPLFVGLYCGTTLLESRKLEELPRELVYDVDPERILAQRAALRVRLVRVEDAAPIAAKLVMLDLLPQQTDTEGRVEYSNLIPGPHSFEILLEDGSTQMHTIVLPAGKLLDFGDVALRPIEKLSVHFESPTGERPQVSFLLQKDEPGDPVEALALGPTFESAQDDPTRIPYPGAGSFVLRVFSVSGPAGNGSAHLSALPLRVKLGDAPGERLTVQLLPTTAVCLRPPRDARHDSRWLIALEDGEPFKVARCRGREPTSVELPQGSYTIARIDPMTQRPGTPRAFRVEAAPSTVELKP